MIILEDIDTADVLNTTGNGLIGAGTGGLLGRLAYDIAAKRKMDEYIKNVHPIYKEKIEAIKAAENALDKEFNSDDFKNAKTALINNPTQDNYTKYDKIVDDIKRRTKELTDKQTSAWSKYSNIRKTSPVQFLRKMRKVTPIVGAGLGALGGIFGGPKL